LAKAVEAKVEWFRGACVTIHNAYCWILVKWGGQEYAEGSKSVFKGEE